MKKTLPFAGLLLCCLISLSSCKKYEDGPWISFSKPENRIRGIWELSSVYKNGSKTATESPSEVESVDGTWELYKTGTVLITYYSGSTILKSDGSWVFDDNKEKLDMTFTTRYSSVSRTYKILRLTHKELKLQYTDPDGVKWVLAFSMIQSFAGYEY
ncbi:MAG: hypothetical protein J5873_06625 [Bacteroidales bacterium]|nr:hypothetical protein [Bacteroidales bacterium]